MARLKRFLAPLFVAIVTVAAAPLAGCSGRAVLVAEDAPPPSRAERVTYRPGHVWVGGHWERRGRHWMWRDGYYQRERPGFVYIEGRWQHTTNGLVWVEGGWRRRSGVVTRRN